MKFISTLRVTPARFPVKHCCLLLCLFACLNSSHWASAQTTQPENPPPVITLTGGRTEWGEGPESSYVRSVVLVPGGSSLIDYEYVYRSSKGFKAALKDCGKDAFRIVADSNVLDLKGRTTGRRVVITILDANKNEGAILCRSETKNRRLRKIYGPTLAALLAYEIRQYPK